MQLMPYLIGSLKILLAILFVVTLLTYLFNALKGFGKKAAVGITDSDAEKLNARKEKMEVKNLKPSVTQKTSGERKIKKSVSKTYSSREIQERRYRRVRQGNRLTVINDTL